MALAWQVVTPLPDTFQSLGDPSTARPYYVPLERWLAAHGGARDRIEIPYTFNHWETAYLAPQFQLARGWLRQADIARNRLFYDDRLTSARYQRWLRRERDRASSRCPIPGSTTRLSRRPHSCGPSRRTCGCAGRPGTGACTRCAAPAGWSRRGSGRARLAALGPESFTLRVSKPGTFLVRVRATPYWRVADGPACVGSGRAVDLRTRSRGRYRAGGNAFHARPRRWQRRRVGATEC